MYKYAWLPLFDFGVAYENEHWWDDVQYTYDAAWFVQALEKGVEVARAELDDPGHQSRVHVSSELGPERLEIQFIEVATAARRRGIGTRVVRALEVRHADWRLFAYSEEADEFWASLGWERFDHTIGLNRALFISPRHDSIVILDLNSAGPQLSSASRELRLRDARRKPVVGCRCQAI